MRPFIRRHVGVAELAVLFSLAAATTRSPSSGGRRQRGGPAGESLDRDGLIQLTDDYLAALAAHDPGSVPLAGEVRIVENTERIRPGEGLWATTTGGPTEFAIHVPDPEQQTAGFLGLVERDGSPVLLGLRLQLEGGRIVAVDHLVAANLAEADLRRNLQTPRPSLLAEIPPRQRLPEHTLREIAATYYEALERNDGSLAPFAPECERHENGMITGGPNHEPRADSRFPHVAPDCTAQIDSRVFTYIAAIENRRIFAADRVTGLAMGLSQFRHPMDNVPYDVVMPDGSTITFTPEFAPFDLPAAHVFKIGPDERIENIEAMGFVAPYGAGTGW